MTLTLHVTLLCFLTQEQSSFVLVLLPTTARSPLLVVLVAADSLASPAGNTKAREGRLGRVVRPPALLSEEHGTAALSLAAFACQMLRFLTVVLFGCTWLTAVA